MKKTFVFLALLSVLGCKRESVNNPDYFIFGYVNGFCLGNCVTLFKLEGDNLYPDADATIQQFAAGDIPFQTSSLPAEKVVLAKVLQAQIPASIYDEPDGNVGCPNCADQGLYFIKIKTGDTVREWRIDPDSQQYDAFGKAVQETLNQLQ
jgi:hypothetical protein